MNWPTPLRKRLMSRYATQLARGRGLRETSGADEVMGRHIELTRWWEWNDELSNGMEPDLKAHHGIQSEPDTIP